MGTVGEVGWEWRRRAVELPRAPKHAPASPAPQRCVRFPSCLAVVMLRGVVSSGSEPLLLRVPFNGSRMTTGGPLVVALLHPVGGRQSGDESSLLLLSSSFVCVHGRCARAASVPMMSLLCSSHALPRHEASQRSAHPMWM